MVTLRSSVSMIAFSTNWNASRERDGERLVQEILDLGFDTLELGHGLSVSQLQGIRQAYARGNFRVLSIHNFCPMPIEVLVDNPDCYEFSSYRPQERARALHLTQRSMATAREFGARFLVLHLGRILPFRGMTDELLASMERHEVASSRYAALKLKAVQKREKGARVYLERVTQILEQLLEEASKTGLILAVENRSDFEAIPTERELLALLKRFDSPHLRYWHDFGHAQMRENLGLLDHSQWLAEIAPYAVGAHLQDAAWPDKDHLVPFAGEIPFDRLVPLLPSSLPYVLELSSRSQPEAIRSAVERWKSQFHS
jgi:sugar phosphate isomerase/epimerase